MTDTPETTDPRAKPTEDVDRRSVRPHERILLLDMWQRSGLTAVAYRSRHNAQF